MSWLRTIARGVDDLIFPRQCLACERPYSADVQTEAFCPDCAQTLFHDPGESCPRCSATVGPHVDVTDGCPKCRGDSFAFESAFRMGPYDGLLQEVVVKMKHLAGESLAEAVGREWARSVETRFRSLNVHALVPVPLHWRRTLERGFNQSEAVAQGLSAVLGIPCRTRWLRRSKFSPISPSQTLVERRENIRGAFRVGRFANVRNVRILLIDDVLTTGATANEAAAALKKAGAAQVGVAVVAHR